MRVRTSPRTIRLQVLVLLLGGTAFLVGVSILLGAGVMTAAGGVRWWLASVGVVLALVGIGTLHVCAAMHGGDR